MDPNVAFFLHQKVRQFENQASSALHRINVAKTMRDVKFAADLHPDALIRHAHEVTREKQRVLRAATDRMSELLDIQLEEMRMLPTAQDMKDWRGRMLQHHWPYLRGAYAQVYVRADRTSQSIIYMRSQAESAASENESAGDAPSA